MTLGSEVLSLVTNVGTMLMIVFIVDKAYRLIWHWLDLQGGRLTDAQIRGPKPIVLSKVVSEEDFPS